MLWSKPLHCSSCMFRIVVLLEGEPPNQSQVFCRGFLWGWPSIWFHHTSHYLWPASLSLLKKSTSIAWHCHHQVSRLYKLMYSVRFPKNSILVSSDHMIHMTCVKLQIRILFLFSTSTCFLFRHFFSLFFCLSFFSFSLSSDYLFNIGFSSSHSSINMWCVECIVVLWTDFLSRSVDLCSSTWVSMSLLVAFQINALLTWSN